MATGIVTWLNQYWGMRRAMLRQIATAQGLSFIHVEIIEYLGNCNRYSNTMLAVAEFFGQTKGSVSQSIAWLEKHAYIVREPDKSDKRIQRLILTPKGQVVLEKVHDLLPECDAVAPNLESELRSLLLAWRAKADLNGFGICGTCHYNACEAPGEYRCKLTGEALHEKEVRQICREHTLPRAVV
ncbi:MAG: MarR family winged helix-turn-helix transcriptional regulator [Alphaproteobacteria bacterium]